MKATLTTLFVLGSLAASGSPAGADSLAVFYSGGTGFTNGSFQGSGTVYDATKNTSINTCTGSCNQVNGDVIQSSITFNNGIIATTNATNVWFDQTPNFGGLGLQTATGPAGTGDDQIEASGVLHLHFSSNVILTGIGTLFAPAHTDFGGGVLGGNGPGLCTSSSSFCTVPAGKDFLLSTDGINFNTVLFSTANNTANSFGGPAGSKDFYFKEDGTGNPEFYVSALTYNPVPGPIVGAGLPGLIAACGGLLGLARRRRTSAAAA